MDGEIRTRRGRLRVEVGLIEAGNPEVIMDKVARVGARGMVIFDRIGPKSNASQVAENEQVAFIQIRNNRPLTQIYNHLVNLVDKPLQPPPEDSDSISDALKKLPGRVVHVKESKVVRASKAGGFGITQGQAGTEEPRKPVLPRKSRFPRYPALPRIDTGTQRC